MNIVYVSYMFIFGKDLIFWSFDPQIHVWLHEHKMWDNVMHENNRKHTYRKHSTFWSAILGLPNSRI